MDKANGHQRKSLAHHKAVVKKWRKWCSGSDREQDCHEDLQRVKDCCVQQRAVFTNSGGVSDAQGLCFLSIPDRKPPIDQSAAREKEECCSQEGFHAQTLQTLVRTTRSSGGVAQHQLRASIYREGVGSRTDNQPTGLEEQPAVLSSNIPGLTYEGGAMRLTSGLPFSHRERNASMLQLDPKHLVSSSVYRESVLRTIRHSLSSGQSVLLVSDIPSGDGVSLADIKVYLQQLCSVNLLFCRHDQSILPVVDSVHGRLMLELTSRVAHMATHDA